jgi:hypothetical protein
MNLFHSFCFIYLNYLYYIVLIDGLNPIVGCYMIMLFIFIFLICDFFDDLIK